MKPAGPILKWVGGKTQLLPEIEKRLPPGRWFQYVEPFLGGGAVFFHLKSLGRIGGRALLSDSNEELLTVYRRVQDQPESVLWQVRHFAAEARVSPERYYYRFGLADRATGKVVVGSRFRS